MSGTDVQPAPTSTAPAVADDGRAGARARAAAVARGAAKAAELGQEMHFGVEGHTTADNARRLEAAHAIETELLRDGQAALFPLASVIKHGGNLSEVVNDPAMQRELRETLNLPVEPTVTADQSTINHSEHGTEHAYLDSVVASLRLKEQYGSDKVLQKAMEAASFASSQQQFPVAHAAAGKGKTGTTTRSNAPEQRQRQQPGLAR